ncbi:hypothetical protein [Vulcanisaeta sp. JCM 14467]|uniref:hypothetical protein n=1 Tax=Vulcanisaeta sp. JCM 14467 TaxID=1295370 RepID=UPI000AF375D2|nr:hypothetical protein [Vulcanisaeta sp. JCM 14467]
MSNGRLSERGLIIITAIVWTAIAVSSIVLVLKVGASSTPYLLMLFIIAVPIWAGVIKQRGKGISDTELENKLAELSSKISELSAKIDELKKAMEE